jgi:hypothetical protein
MRTDASVRIHRFATGGELMAAPATTDRATQTEDRILRVAMEVFADEGFHGADVQVIAHRAGVGKGTVYRHFGDKDSPGLAADPKWSVQRKNLK